MQKSQPNLILRERTVSRALNTFHSDAYADHSAVYENWFVIESGECFCKFRPMMFQFLFSQYGLGWVGYKICNFFHKIMNNDHRNFSLKKPNVFHFV